MECTAEACLDIPCLSEKYFSEFLEGLWVGDQLIEAFLHEHDRSFHFSEYTYHGQTQGD